MKIAFFHELKPGGARRCVNEFAINLKKNHQVDLYLVDEKQEKDEERFFNSIFFYPFIPKSWSGKNWKARFYKDTFELIRLNKLHKKIARDIDNKQYDIVIINPSQFTQAPFMLKYLKTKNIYYGQEPLRIVYDTLLATSSSQSKTRLLYEKLNRFLRKKIDRLNFSYAEFPVAPSKYRARLFEEIYHKTMKVIYCGVDSSFFKPAVMSKDIDLLYIGSHNTIDGYDTFLEALNYVKHKIKVRTILTDEEWISGDDKLRAIYQRSKILVCTARKEGLGLSTLEALACGSAVVAVAEAGHKETVEDKTTGFLVPRNAQKIAQKIDWLLAHPNVAKKMGENGRESIVKHWTWKKRSTELENFINSVVNKTID
jgi:glycosyltransferase involved in cell wall biosynthesis